MAHAVVARTPTVVPHPSLSTPSDTSASEDSKPLPPPPLSRNVFSIAVRNAGNKLRCDARHVFDGFSDVEMTADWSDFDHYCRSNGFKYPLLVKRLACMLISGAAHANLLDILQPASLTPEMISNPKMEEGFGLLRNAFIDSNFTDERISFLTKQWLMHFLNELAGGYDDLLSSLAASLEAEEAGNYVYMLQSFYNHDCDPNAHIVWIDNSDARLKALRDVDEGLSCG